MTVPLLATPDNPIPPGATLLSVRTADGLSLRVATWAPTARVVHGTVCLVQGRAEFIEKYFETVAELRGRGFHVVAFDWRGQGGSDRTVEDPHKGHVDDFAEYRLDLAAVEAHERRRQTGWWSISKICGSHLVHRAVEFDASMLEPECPVAMVQREFPRMCCEDENLCLLQHRIQSVGCLCLEIFVSHAQPLVHHQDFRAKHSGNGEGQPHLHT